MPLYKMTDTKLEKVPQTSFIDEKILERQDLQRKLRESPEVLDGNILIISEEYGEFEESGRSIDLLAVDRGGDLVVIELKRDKTGTHMELQAIRYAAMVSNLRFADLVEIYQKFMNKMKIPEAHKAKDILLEFLHVEQGEIPDISNTPRILLVSQGFSKEITTAVMWLNDQGLDIKCIQLQPYKEGSAILLDISQVIPLPSAEEYQIQRRRKTEEEKLIKEIKMRRS